jgi:hypothetical protein
LEFANEPQYSSDQGAVRFSKSMLNLDNNQKCLIAGLKEKMMLDNRSSIRVLALLCCIAGATMLVASAGNADPNSKPTGAAPEAVPPPDDGAAHSDVAKDGSEPKAVAGTGFTLDPCSLLTNAEVSEQLGRQVLKVPNRDQQPMCEWTPDGKAGIDSSAFLEYQKQNSRFHLDVIRDLKRPKTGPGVRCFDIGNGALLSMARRDISVLVGTSTFRIGGGGSIPISDEALVNLARLAQPRAH